MPIRVLTATALLLVGGCTTAASPTVGPSASPTGPADASTSTPAVTATGGAAAVIAPAGLTTIKCTDSIAGEAPDASLKLVSGVVALPTSAAHPALQTTRTGEPAPAARLSAKTGLVVRADRPVELLVPAGAPDRLAIGWGNPASPSRRGIFVNCPDTWHTGWLNFAGGYFLDHPACVAVNVRSAAVTRSVPLGLGVGCPGQQSPEGPSES